jgi:hypothetical protein
MKMHYLLLYAIRESTNSLVRKQVKFTGNKHAGMAEAWNDWQEELGCDWLVGGSITTRCHFAKVVELREQEHQFWNSLLR